MPWKAKMALRVRKPCFISSSFTVPSKNTWHVCLLKYCTHANSVLSNTWPGEFHLRDKKALISLCKLEVAVSKEIEKIELAKTIDFEKDSAL